MLDRDAIIALVPQHGSMCLLERVLNWNETSIRLATGTHRSPDNPLRSNGQLRAVHLCEYGAQAMAVHGGLLGTRPGEVTPRLLVSLRDVKLHADRIDLLGGDLIVDALRLLDGGASWQYSFQVSHLGQLLAEGRAAATAGRIVDNTVR